MLRFITTVYTLMFLLMVALAIMSFFGVFSDPNVNPGM